MKKLLFFILTITAVIVCRAEVTLGFSGEHAAQVGIYIKDLNTGEVIAANDEEKALTPASITKALTAATALTSLSPDFRFATKVYLTGSINAGVCSGNLVIVGCADPTIDSENFDDRPTFASEIIDALNQKGITHIQGSIIVEESLLGAGCIPEWEIDDVPWSYGAGLYGFNFSDNTYKLWPASKKSVPAVPDINLKVLSGKSENLIRGIDSDNLTVYGKKPTDPSWRVTTTMNSPARAFEYDLTKKLNDKGIKVEGKKAASDSRQLLTTHYSPLLRDILTELMVYSHNLYAEGMLRALAPTSTRKQALEKQASLWRDRGMSFTYNKVLDGSGLSRADRLQPILLANILEWMAKSDYADEYVAMFPRVGEDGTVKNLLKDTSLKGTLALKSGSMNAVQCFAGYKIDSEGQPTHVVVIMINAFYCERGQLRGYLEKFLLDTFSPKPET